MYNIPTELNKPVEGSLTINLGFSISRTKIGYRKKFFLSSYDSLEIRLFLKEEQFKELKQFLNYDLKYSTEEFLGDFGLGEKTYSIVENPQFELLEGSIYLVSMTLLQKKEDLDTTCMYIVPCFRLLEKNLKQINTLEENNIESTYTCKNTNLCMLNTLNLVKEGVNEYIRKTVLV